MKMNVPDDSDIDRILQAELDALSSDDDYNEENPSDDEDEHRYELNDQQAQQIIDETREHLERAMQERLKAFENEVNMNFQRYTIDYDEIDELLQKPTSNIEHEIQGNVARECGIEREELDQILNSINAEESVPESMDESDVSNNEEDETPRVKIVKKSLSPVVPDEPMEVPPEEQEDPNKKIHDERLAESHRRMLDELALLEQRRKEEEERYAVVLQEQQQRLAEEYLRLQETLDENVRQTNQEKVQWEQLWREQELLLNDRQNKMAIVIQAWYRGKRVYRQYHKQIQQRTAPALRAIAKKRKKKEQEALANVAKLAQIQETSMDEKENRLVSEEKTNPISMPLPSTNRLSSPSPNLVTKPPTSTTNGQPLAVKTETVPSKNDATKKKKGKQQPALLIKQTSSSLASSAQIVQMENPTDFMPTIVPEPKYIPSPRVAQIEPRSITSPRPPPQEQRPKSSDQRSRSARMEIPPAAIIPSVPETVPVEPNIINVVPLETARQPVETTQKSDPKLKKVDRPPLSMKRSETFEKDLEHLQSPIIDSVAISSRASNESSTPRPTETAISSVEKIPPLVQSIVTPTVHQVVTSENLLPITNQVSISQSMETIPIRRESHRPVSPLQPSNTDAKETNIPPTPRVATPRRAHRDEKRAHKITNRFLEEARRWAHRTRDLTFGNLLTTAEELVQQQPMRKTAANLRKLPDLSPDFVAKIKNHHSPHDIQYLLIEQVFNPCSLSLISTTFINLTHLTIRQCKLVQLMGLDSCSSLTILDIENNWLEQVHLQLQQLEYLNMSRNRITSLLSIQTPSLKYLNVSHNRLTRLNGIENFVNLNVLLATSNQLLTTIGLQGCTRLLLVDLSDNHLVEMDQLDQCPLLISVKAMSNALIQVPNLFNAILLHEFDLSSNSLNSFDDLCTGNWLPFLTHLRLSSNSLQDLSLIQLPALQILDLSFNQLFDVQTLKEFIKNCSSLVYLNLEQNPVIHDKTSLDSALLTPPSEPILPLPLLPQLSNEPTTSAIQSYLNFLTNITSLFIKLRQTIEQYQDEPFPLLKSVHQQCQEYQQTKIAEPTPPSLPAPVVPIKVVSPDEQNIIRLQSHWRRRLAERRLKKRHRAAQIIQARWRGYIVRQRMRAVRHFFRHQIPTTFDEIDLSQFDFDEAAFDARFQAPPTPVTRTRQVWQPPPEVMPRTTKTVESPRPHSSRSSSAASSRAKLMIEPLAMPTRTNQITAEWGLTPTSTTAALMLKRAERMKWNVERKHKREHMDAFQRLQMARQSELPPGSLRMAKRHTSIPNGKPVAQMKTLSPPSTSMSRPNRIFEWVHTQVARFEEPPTVQSHSPRYERKRLPSLDGSTDSALRSRTSELLSQTHTSQQRGQQWTGSTVSTRQPPPLLPPIIGHHPRS